MDRRFTDENSRTTGLAFLSFFLLLVSRKNWWATSTSLGAHKCKFCVISELGIRHSSVTRRLLGSTLLVESQLNRGDHSLTCMPQMRPERLNPGCWCTEAPCMRLIWELHNTLPLGHAAPLATLNPRTRAIAKTFIAAVVTRLLVWGQSVSWRLVMHGTSPLNYEEPLVTLNRWTRIFSYILEHFRLR